MEVEIDPSKSILQPQNQLKPESHQEPKTIVKPDPLRDAVIDELSRKKLVYAPEEGAYVARKQIN